MREIERLAVGGKASGGRQAEGGDKCTSEVGLYGALDSQRVFSGPGSHKFL